MRSAEGRTFAEERRRAMLRDAGGPGLRVNMTPMIDVVFLLLIYFVLVADFAAPTRIAPLDVVQRDVAGSSDLFALPEVPTVLAITSRGDEPTSFDIASDQRAFADIASFAEALATLGARHPIIVDASAARWEHAVVAYRTLRETGFERVELTAED